MLMFFTSIFSLYRHPSPEARWDYEGAPREAAGGIPLRPLPQKRPPESEDLSISHRMALLQNGEVFVDFVFGYLCAVFVPFGDFVCDERRMQMLAEYLFHELGFFEIHGCFVE